MHNGWVSNIWVSDNSLRVFRALTASSSLKSMLNWAIEEASVREDRKLMADPGVETELDVILSVWRVKCVHCLLN